MHSFGALPDGFILTGNSHWATRNSDLDARCTLAQLQVTDGARRAYQRRKELEADQDHWEKVTLPEECKTEQSKPEKPFFAYRYGIGWTQEAKDLVRQAIEDGLIKKAGHDETEFMLHRYSEIQRLKMYG